MTHKPIILRTPAEAASFGLSWRFIQDGGDYGIFGPDGEVLPVHMDEHGQPSGWEFTFPALVKLSVYYLKMADEQASVAADRDTAIDQKRHSSRLARRYREVATMCLESPTVGLVEEARAFDCGWCDQAHPQWLPPRSCPLHRTHYVAA